MKSFGVFLIAALPVLIACSSPQEMSEATVSASGESVQAQLERRVGAGAAAENFSDEETRGEAKRDFAYSWPAQASAIAPLAAILVEARNAAQAQHKAEWERSIVEFADIDCVTCVNRSYDKSWSIAADTPRLLVMSASNFTYTGGAHGNTVFDALLWDREANGGEGTAMRPVDVFVGETALENTAFGEYCQALLEARGERLEMNVDGLNPFENCPSISDLVVVFKSTNGETLDQISFFAAAYVAGSYAEGPYIFDIPMTRALIDVVRPEYRAAFSIGE